MRNGQRSVDPLFQVRRLEERHSELKRRIAELDGKHYLNAREEMRIQHLKKRKLATKDLLQSVRQNLEHG